EKELKEKQKVTSRGGQTRRQQSSYSSGAPLATYSYISSYYGMRNGKMHTGVDFAAPAGTKIYAWKAGKVIQASWSGSYGNFIVIQHNDGTISRYAHCSGYACSKGDVVSKGQVIGYVGTTGNSTGNHLHLEIKVNGSFVNPLNYL
ncbi:TPA: M23 family metallopeptidase, partial [Candidatus Ventrenecus avicola]|nr:M23 family metallopeptidase [Candidatus Ventrenecus avicola]